MTLDIVLLALLLGLIPAFIARGKSQPFVFFWLIGALVFPLGLLIAVLIKDVSRRCPYCAEKIRDAAIVCPHCHRQYAH